MNRKIKWSYFVILLASFVTFVWILNFYLSHHDFRGSLISILKKNKLYQEQTKKSNPNPYEITMVTLYIPLDKSQNKFPTDTYRIWMRTFGWMSNKLVALVTDDTTMNHLKKIRSHLPPERTVLIRVNRSQFGSFKDLDRVKKIFSQPHYPIHRPNTVNAEYPITMNAKYDALQMAMDMGHVDTDYIAWVDIGYFRNLLYVKTPKNYSFTLEIPLDFEDTKIGFSEVGPRVSHTTPWDYIRHNIVWVAGGFVLGKKPVIQKFIKNFKRAFQNLLNHSMASTDQQTIGAMYSPQMIKEQNVKLKTYSCPKGRLQFQLFGSDLQYFCLGYICKEDAQRRRARVHSGQAPQTVPTESNIGL
nr:hypothetical protein BgiMline_029521 [Biomphalaria glabrata]